LSWFFVSPNCSSIQIYDVMTIKDLGRWESLEMVQRYTRSVSFQDSLKFYKALYHEAHQGKLNLITRNCRVKSIYSLYIDCEV